MSSQHRAKARREAAEAPRLKIYQPEPNMAEPATAVAPPASSPPANASGNGADLPKSALEYPHSPLPAPDKTPIGFQPLVATPELMAELAAASAALENAQPEEIIAWAAQRFAPYLTMATAFGPEGCVIISMLAQVAPDTHVFNLDTGYQFQETL